MASPLNDNLFLVRQHPSILKAAFEYDVLNPVSGEIILECRETSVGRMTKVFRLMGYKATTPFDIKVFTPAGKPVARVARGVPVTKSRVKVYDQDNQLVGGFHQKKFSFGGAFDVVDASGKALCRLDGGLTGWNFRFVTAGGEQLARVTKKWAGLGKELLTSADDYVLEIDDSVPSNSSIRLLIFASVICIGIVTKIELP